ncbi:hypothetical protein T265_02116 [Opisthorchis viverrini]|uniref:Uncharacterized protein n=1 Tax=Opisthorchis viverrini TaxID=6198 RepID=A0A075A7V6_OPIVI|nr:hypothetical protein T265_02116 [Opisthorchis viverrini]KER31755.1 hypothetical protein T265_02116 [Opisthorchis viverrini]
MNHDSTRQDGLFAMAYLVITYPMFSLRYLDSLIASMVPSKQRDCIRANEILSKSWWTSTIFFHWCIGPVATLVHSKSSLVLCWRIPKFSASVLQLCLSNCGPGYVVGKMILLEKVSAIKKDLIVLNQVRAKFHVNSNDALGITGNFPRRSQVATIRTILQLCLFNCGPGYVVGKMILLEKVSAIKKDLIVLNQVRAKFHVNSNDVKLYEPPFRCHLQGLD